MNSEKESERMPWESKTVEKLREEFVTAAKESTNFSSLCREFHITRKTGYKWLERANRGKTMSDESRAPHHIPTKTPPEIETKILRLRQENPAWGAKKLRNVLETDGVENLPCVRTINNILERNGLISEEQSRAHTPYTRFEKDSCNEMWQTDFKGEFRMEDGRYCYPLNILDDHSRFLLATKPSLCTGNLVKDVFERTFYEFGMPYSVLCDHGGEFAGFNGGYTQFEKWLMDHDVLPVHGRVRHPQTQGKVERFHRTMKEELLNHTSIRDIENAEIVFREWREKYNSVRPHEALGMKRPAQVYHRSEREYTPKRQVYEYDESFHIIKVNSWGYVRFNGFQIYLSETMIGEYIQFRPNPHRDSFFACYRNYRIAEFDAISGELLSRFIAKL